MIFSLNGTEMLDWQEVWCFRCEHDHGWSHTPCDEDEEGCTVLLTIVQGLDAPELKARDPEWWRTLPAEVSCSKFKECTRCGPEPVDAERRGGLTRREFFDQYRNRMLARPVIPQPKET